MSRVKVFTIDVGSVPSSEVDAYMEKMKNMKVVPSVSYEEMVRLGYYTPQKFTRWQNFKRWLRNVAEVVGDAISYMGGNI
jgi:hypothetical protein